MKVVVEKSETTLESSTKQFLCGPCANYGGCR